MHKKNIYASTYCMKHKMISTLRKLAFCHQCDFHYLASSVCEYDLCIFVAR